MNAPEDNYESLAPLRDLPIEVSLDQVAHMVAVFPLAVGATGWRTALKTNLNTILMISTGSILIGIAIHFMAFRTPQVQTSTETWNPEIQAPAQLVEKPKMEKAQPLAILTLPADDKARALAPAELSAQEPAPQAGPSPRAGIHTPPNTPPLAPVPPTPPMPQTGNAPPPPTPAALPAAALPQYSANERTYDVRDFNAVASLSSADIFIEEGTWMVTASGDPDLLERLDIVVENGVLKISMKNKKGISFNNKEGLKVEVHLPQLTRLDQGGSGNIRIGELSTTKELAVTIMGSGDIDLNSVKVSDTLSLFVKGSGNINCHSAIVSGHTAVSVMGSGDVKASGTTATIEVIVQGSGDADVSAMQAQTGKVSILGSGDASVNCIGKLERLVQGSGALIEK